MRKPAKAKAKVASNNDIEEQITVMQLDGSETIETRKKPPRPTPAPPPPAAPTGVIVGDPGSLQINLLWDASVPNAPVGFEAAAVEAAKIFTTRYKNPVQINIQCGYGTVGGVPIAGNSSARSSWGVYAITYTQLRTALLAGGLSPDQFTAYAYLTLNDPLMAVGYRTTLGHLKALGLSNSTALDGSIGLNSATYRYSMTDPPAAGCLDAIDLMAHEMSEILGRNSFAGKQLGANLYGPLDLFRYASPRTYALASIGSCYFSIDNGVTQLRPFNNTPGEDYGDWTTHADCFGVPLYGVTDGFSAVDAQTMNILGYKI